MNNENKEKEDETGKMSTHLAWLRTRLSVERTLEAWVRTAISLIGFGFAIVQFFERLDVMQGVRHAYHPNLSRYTGLTLIGIGTVGLGIAIWQYNILLNYLRSSIFHEVSGIKGVRRVPTLIVVAVTLCMAGAAAFATILFRVP